MVLHGIMYTQQYKASAPYWLSMLGPAQGTAAYHQWSQHSCQNIHHQTTNYWMPYYCSSKINDINCALQGLLYSQVLQITKAMLLAIICTGDSHDNFSRYVW